ncbi:hypothetical protein [Actinomyces howellii]|uniref:Uncharacterized protein n=1 Tax=Actinomyces howellii TaxID=52771 RepID=A0A3S4RXL7_9ACTO|nr:hypothetical protein [Actinomyces howellii]VEG29306.1 Uncharacterised protein [Actinomyces howellii]
MTAMTAMPGGRPDPGGREGGRSWEDRGARARVGLLLDTPWPPYRAVKARTRDLCRRDNALDDCVRLAPGVTIAAGAAVSGRLAGKQRPAGAGFD